MSQLTDLLDKAITAAHKEARKPSRRRFFIAAFGLRADGATVSASNHDTPFPMPDGHAEARLSRKLTPGSVVAVARVNRSGDTAIAKPCARCACRLRNRGVQYVYYTHGAHNAYSRLDLTGGS